MTALIAGAVLAVGGGLAVTASGQNAQTPGICGTTHWVGVWTADPSGALGNGNNNQTLRIILTPHIGGSIVRVHITDRDSPRPLTLTHASIAQRQSGASIVAGSSRSLTFNGQQSVTVAVGTEVVSDPVSIDFAPFEDLAVSLYAAGVTGQATGHLIARERSYATSQGTGDHTSDTGAGAFTTSTTTSVYVDGVDALEPPEIGAAVLFGDSITDGFEGGIGGGGEEQGGIDLNHRYPDYLAARLLTQPGGPRLSIVNAGVSGNRLLVDGSQTASGAAGLVRLNTDLIGVAGVTDAIVDEGINDIALLASAQQVEGALTQIVNRLHAAGIRVQLATLTPAGTGLLNLGSIIPSLFIDSSSNAVRVAVNTWLRSGASGADGVVDFDEALRSSTNGFELNPGFDSGDHVHPSYTGYSKMADTVNLDNLRGAAPCVPPPPPQVTKLRVRAGGRPHHDLRASGTLTTPDPTDCTGAQVTVKALRHGRSLLKRNLILTPACTFAKTFALHATGRIEVRVSFGGRPGLLASHAASVFARVR